MVLIGLEHCPGCMIIKSRHPELPFKEVPRKIGPNTPKELIDLKKLMGKLGIEEYPVLMNDEMTEVLSLKLIEPNIQL